MRRRSRPKGKFTNLRRLKPSFLALVLTLAAAALTPGAAVFASQTPASCPNTLPPLSDQVLGADLIVVGTVVGVTDGVSVQLRPTVYLKGPAQAGDIDLHYPQSEPGCPLASFAEDTSMVVLLQSHGGDLQWPARENVYVVSGGVATNQLGGSPTQPESALVDEVRGMTGQYAVPATDAGEGATLDWVKVVLPTTVVSLIVFGLGLLFMRTWHRIDPT